MNIPSAPPTTVRMTARRGLALPSVALSAPVIARESSTTMNVTGTRTAAGVSKIASSGRAAPALKEIPEAIDAACGLVSA